LTVLARHADGRGECTPSMAVLTKEASLSDRSVQGAVRSLAAAGVISIDIGGGRASLSVILCAGHNQRQGAYYAEQSEESGS
jgi:hypothetical protein